MSAETNGNFISDLAMPNRILYSTNIVKVECRDKRKSYFQLGYAETNPITNIVKGERRGKYSKILPLGKTKLKQSLFCSALAYLYLCIRMQKRENVTVEIIVWSYFTV